MSGKSINFDNKKIYKSNFYKKQNCSRLNTKKNHMVKKAKLNTLLDIAMMMTLDNYV